MKNKKMDEMKKAALVFIGLMVFTCSNIMAQEHGREDDFEKKYHAQKIAYLTTEMDLSPEEAALFWPLYNAHEKEKGVLIDEMKLYRREVSQKEDEFTEEEALAALLFLQKNMDQMHDLEKQYQNQYLEVISAKKVLILLKGEKEFRRKLLRELGYKRKHRNRSESTKEQE